MQPSPLQHAYFAFAAFGGAFAAIFFAEAFAFAFAPDFAGAAFAFEALAQGSPEAALPALLALPPESELAANLSMCSVMIGLSLGVRNASTRPCHSHH